MNIKIIACLAILIFIAGAYGIPWIAHQIDPDPFKDNPAAKELRQLGINVSIEDLGHDGNGYTVQGQTRFWIYDNGNVKIEGVYLDDDIDPNSYKANAILYHEEGHVILGPGATEADCDNYAASKGYNIRDAYHGVH